MAELLARYADIVVAGTAENQGEFYDRFQHVVLLSVPASEILERVRHRTNNPYGNSSEQQAEILGYLETVEPLLRRGATLELDRRAPVNELASVIEGLVRAPT
jgi:shikimate kinase